MAPRVQFSASFPSVRLNLRRELREVVNAELLFDPRDFVDHLFKAIVSEEFVFFLLEIFA